MLNVDDNADWDDNVVQCSCCVDDEEVVNQTLSASSPSDNDSGNDGDDEGAEDVQDGDYDASRNVIITLYWAPIDDGEEGDDNIVKMMIMTKFVPQGLPEVVIQLEGYSMAYHSLPRGRFILLRVICRGKSAHFRLQLTTGETKVMIR